MSAGEIGVVNRVNSGYARDVAVHEARERPGHHHLHERGAASEQHGEHGQPEELREHRGFAPDPIREVAPPEHCRN